METLLGQCCGEAGGVARGVTGADPDVRRQVLLFIGLLRPIAARFEMLLVSVLLQATAPDRSTLDDVLRPKVLLETVYG